MPAVGRVSPGTARLVREAQAIRQHILTREAAVGDTLVSRVYGAAWRQVQPLLDKLLGKAEDQRRITGRVSISTAWTLSQPETQQFMAALRDLLQQAGQQAAQPITAEQQQIALQGEQFAANLLRLALEAEHGAPPKNWNATRIPPGALVSLAGRFGANTPIGQWLAAQAGVHTNAVRNELLMGLSAGQSPRQIAEHIRAGMGGSIVQALALARTAILGSYRASALASYRANSDVVQGWVWLSAQQLRTCPVCWAKHGSFHPLWEEFVSHAACRCAPIPSTRTFAELGRADLAAFETTAQVPAGADLFARLSQAQQRQILGPTKFAAYSQGKLQLADLVGSATSPVWGDYLYEKSARSLGLRRAA